MGTLIVELAAPQITIIISMFQMNAASDICYTGDCVNDLEKIHLKFTKSTLGVRKQTPTPAIYGDTGRFPLIIRQHIKAVKYWCRILDLSLNHPVRNAYIMLLELDSTGFTNWCSRIRSVLELTKLGQHSTLAIQINACFSLKIQLLEYFHSGGDKIFIIKKSLCVEPYVLNIKGNHLITAMTRYRMSSHDLK